MESAEWGLGMTLLALLSVLAVFALAFWFIRAAMAGNKRFRWLQLIDRRQRRGTMKSREHRN